MSRAKTTEEFHEKIDYKGLGNCLNAIKGGWIAALLSMLISFINAMYFAWSNANYDVLRPLFTTPVLINIAILCTLTFFIYKKSRVSAVTMFLYFAFDQYAEWSVTGEIRDILMTLCLIFFYGNAIRGTFVWHSRYKNIVENLSDEFIAPSDIQEKGMLYPKVVSNELLRMAKSDAKLFVLMYAQEGSYHLMEAEDPSINIEYLNEPSHQPILTQKITEDLSVIYVLDSIDASVVISSAHLKEFGLTLEEINELSINNINEYAFSNKNEHMHMEGFRMKIFKHDGKYESSIILADKFLAKFDASLQGEMFVYIPVSSVCITIDSSDTSAFGEAENLSQMFIQSQPNKLSPNKVKLKNGKIVQPYT